MGAVLGSAPRFVAGRSIVAEPTNFNIKAGGTIAWNNKSTSTLGAVVLKPAGLATYAASGKIASGQFAGKSLAVTATFIPTSGCPFNAAKLSIKKGTKVRVKYLTACREVSNPVSRERLESETPPCASRSQLFGRSCSQRCAGSSWSANARAVPTLGPNAQR